jgi:hypothetical protein
MPPQVLTPKDWGDDRTSKREKDGEGREKCRGKKKKEKSIRVCASFSKENTNPFALERYLGLTPSHSAADIVGGILTVWRGGKSTTLIVLSRLAILKTFGTVNLVLSFVSKAEGKKISWSPLRRPAWEL